MASRRFDICLAETLRWESGEPQIPGGAIRKGKWSYADDPHDPGGPTMVGVIQRVYDAWRRNQGLAPRPVRGIEDHEVRAIYRDQYWSPVRGDDLPAGVDLCVFDFAVNSGVGRAIRYLQRAVGVTPDGHLGEATMAAVRATDPVTLVGRLMADRTQFVRGIRHYWRFGKGWERRLAGIGREALAMAAPGGRALPVTEVATPSIEPANARATQDPPNNMAQSTEGNAAVMVGGTSGVTLAVETSTAVAKATDPETGFSVLAFLLTLAQSTTFWTAAFALGGAAYIWLRRRHRMLTEAV